ncbi:MAG: glycosyltransferase family 9 protein [Verrucomicrobiales bacterium]
MGKVLFIRGGAVGDFILTMPAIKLMRDSLPDNEVEILGYPAIAELATATGLADRVRSIEDARLAPFFAPGARLDTAWCDYFAGFDLVVSYLYDPDGFFEENLKVAGVRTLLSGPFRPDESPPFVPAAAQLARPLEEIALFLDDPALELDYPDESGLSTATDGPLVALHPGSGSPGKNWSFESWVKVLDRLRERFPDAEFLVTGGEAESEIIDQFAELLDAAGIPHRLLLDKSLGQLGALYRNVDLYLGHDSGISHLAASAGAEGVLLFGPTNPEIWAPVSSRMKRVVSPTASPGNISVAQVLEAVDAWSYSQPRRRSYFFGKP